MSKLYVGKQKIFNGDGTVYAYELLFRDQDNGINEMPTNLKATSHVIINALTNINLDALLGKREYGFVNIDERILTSGVLDVLDTSRFVLEILETVELTDKVVERIKYYHKRGYIIALDDFDCSVEMIKKFATILKFIHIVKIDIREADIENIEAVMNKLKSIGTKFLAEKIETKAEYEECLSMGFDFFQGYYLHPTETVEIEGYKEVTHMIILQLIKLIRNDEETAKIEMFIRQKADLAYKLIKFLNNQVNFSTPVESMTQVITLLGREKLLRWLLIYLYSEISTNPASKTIMEFAVNRAEKMEEEAHPRDKDKAYLAGMFSLLGAVFETNLKDLMNQVQMDREITRLVVEKKGKFAHSLMKVEKNEKEYLKKLIFDNFDKLNTVELIYILEFSGVEIDKSRL